MAIPNANACERGRLFVILCSSSSSSRAVTRGQKDSAEEKPAPPPNVIAIFSKETEVVGVSCSQWSNDEPAEPRRNISNRLNAIL